MPLLVYLLHIFHSLLRGTTPCEEYHAPCTHFRHGIDDLLCEKLPTLSRVRVRFVATDGKAGVQHENAMVCPGCEEAAFLGWLLEVGVVLLEGDVDVAERWWGGRRRTHREAQAVSLVGVVIGILTGDDCLDGVEGRVPRPVRAISSCHMAHGPRIAFQMHAS